MLDRKSFKDDPELAQMNKTEGHYPAVGMRVDEEGQQEDDRRRMRKRLPQTVAPLPSEHLMMMYTCHQLGE